MPRRLLHVVLPITVALVTTAAIGLLGTSLIENEDAPNAGAFNVRAELRSRVPDASGRLKDSSTYLRWQYAPPSQWRFETATDESQTSDKVTISDGSTLWQYYPRLALYCKIDMDYQGTVLTIPDGMNPAWIGPSSSATIGEMIDQLKLISPDVQVRSLGTQDYLSIEAEVIEYFPAAAPGSGWGPSVGRLLVDTQSLFVLQHAIHETSGLYRYYEASVMEIQYGSSVSTSEFSFTPPASAAEFKPVEGNCDQGIP